MQVNPFTIPTWHLGGRYDLLKLIMNNSKSILICFKLLYLFAQLLLLVLVIVLVVFSFYTWHWESEKTEIDGSHKIQ